VHAQPGKLVLTAINLAMILLPSRLVLLQHNNLTYGLWPLYTLNGLGQVLLVIPFSTNFTRRLCRV